MTSRDRQNGDVRAGRVLRGASIAHKWIALGWLRLVDLLRVARGDRVIRRLVGTLLAIDLGWIALFGIGRLLDDTGISSCIYDLGELRITTERGYPEIYGYIKTMALVSLLGALWIRNRQPIMGALALLFAVVFLDDAFAVHEGVGANLVRQLSIKGGLGLRPTDYGEVIAWLAIGAIVMPVVLVAVLRSDTMRRVDGLAVLIVFSMLVFCAMVVDQLYFPVAHAFFGCGILLDMIEDGGELVLITVALAAVAALVRLERVPDASADPALAKPMAGSDQR